MGKNTANAEQKADLGRLSASEIQRVQASFGRALWDLEFLDKFYAIFLDSHPDIRDKFVNTDFAKQKGLLRHGLMSVLMFAEGQPSARSCLERIRASHARGNLGISPDLYSYWIDSLMKAVAKSDPEFDLSLEVDWRKVITPAIEFIKSGY
ncbi:MAG: globin [Acidiferrobacterales bacterium]